MRIVETLYARVSCVRVSYVCLQTTVYRYVHMYMYTRISCSGHYVCVSLRIEAYKECTVGRNNTVRRTLSFFREMSPTLFLVFFDLSTLFVPAVQVQCIVTCATVFNVIIRVSHRCV